MAKLGTLLGWGVVGLAGLVVSGVGALFIAAQVVPEPDGLGVQSGRLAPCPSSPNCVSTQADESDRQHAIAPVPLTAPAAEAQARIRELLAAEPRVTVVRDEPGYIHAVFRTPTMRFPDDVELYLDEAAGLIQFRSASRLGRGDMGTNRARMERLRPGLERAGAGVTQ